MVEILENLDQLNGNMTLYFDQKVDFVLILDTQKGSIIRTFFFILIFFYFDHFFIGNS